MSKEWECNHLFQLLQRGSNSLLISIAHNHLSTHTHSTTQESIIYSFWAFQRRCVPYTDQHPDALSLTFAVIKQQRFKGAIDGQITGPEGKSMMNVDKGFHCLSIIVRSKTDRLIRKQWKRTVGSIQPVLTRGCLYLSWLPLFRIEEILCN